MPQGECIAVATAEGLVLCGGGLAGRVLAGAECVGELMRQRLAGGATQGSAWASGAVYMRYISGITSRPMVLVVVSRDLPISVGGRVTELEVVG